MLSINFTLAMVVGVDLAMISLGCQRLRDFLHSVTHIRNHADLEHFQRVAAIQMHISMLHLCACVAITGLSLMAWKLANYPRSAIVIWGILIAGTCLFAQRGRRCAACVQAIPVSNPILAPRRKHVVDTWRHGILPDW